MKSVSSEFGQIDNGFFRPVFPDQPRRRQERRPLFIEAGVAYVANINFLRRTKTLVTENWLAVIASNFEAHDINSLEDFQYAEFLSRQKQGNAGNEPNS